MTILQNTTWSHRLANIDFAFQPIVNIHTGVCYGYEALLRNYKVSGFMSVSELFDHAHTEKALPQVEMLLRKKAIKKFADLLKQEKMKLFFNTDARVLNAETSQDATVAVLKQYSLTGESLCFEISGKNKPDNFDEMAGILKTYRSQGVKIAIDGYGMGGVDLHTLYFIEPDFIKVDRFFIKDIEKDSKKKLFVSNIVEVAHYLGSTVVAVGVETKEEYHVCRDIGCDMIQGYLVQAPEEKWTWLRTQYQRIHLLSQTHREKKSDGDQELINAEIEKIEPVLNETDIFEVFKRFKQKKEVSFFPVINKNGEPLGIIRENSFKDYAYSRFGNELLQNPAFGKTIDKFIGKFPIADIRTPTEKILEIYSRNEHIEGILIVDKMKYAGFLSAASLLKVLNEKNLSAAKDQNPLSKLPGNTLIYEYISKAVRDTKSGYLFVYFDFENFKSYNDKYGFRQGDRVILLFSDMLKKVFKSSDSFIAHAGGDDFFMGFSQASSDKIFRDVKTLLKSFHRDVESFYDPVSIKKGYIISWKGEGKMESVPLLKANAVILELPAERTQVFSVSEIAQFAVQLRQKAKDSEDKVCQANLSDLKKNLRNSFEAAKKEIALHLRPNLLGAI